MRVQARAVPDLYGVYRVAGRRRYRGHEPGDEFTARIDREAERRAIERGDIELLERIVPELEGGSYTLPRGWLSADSDLLRETQGLARRKG